MTGKKQQPWHSMPKPMNSGLDDLIGQTVTVKVKTMPYNIMLTEEITFRPDGDRDPKRHPCSKFQVRASNGKDEIVLAEYDQYDAYHTCITDVRENVLSQARKFAEEQASFWKCTWDPEPIVHVAPYTAAAFEEALDLLQSYYQSDQFVGANNSADDERLETVGAFLKRFGRD